MPKSQPPRKARIRPLPAISPAEPAQAPEAVKPETISIKGTMLKQRVDELTAQVNRAIQEANMAADEKAKLFLEGAGIIVNPGDVIHFDDKRENILLFRANPVAPAGGDKEPKTEA